MRAATCVSLQFVSPSPTPSLDLSLLLFLPLRSCCSPYRRVGVLNCNSSSASASASWKASHPLTHLPHLGFRYRFRFSCVANSHSCSSYSSLCRCCCFSTFSSSSSCFVYVVTFGANLISRSINAFRMPFTTTTTTTTAASAPSFSLSLAHYLVLFLSSPLFFFVRHTLCLLASFTIYRNL